MKNLILSLITLCFLSCAKIETSLITGTWKVASTISINQSMDVYSENYENVYFHINIFNGDSLYLINGYDSSISVPNNRVYDMGEYRFFEDGRVELDLSYSISDDYDEIHSDHYYLGTYSFVKKQNRPNERLLHISWVSHEIVEYFVLADITEYHKHEVSDGAILYSEMYEIIEISDSEMKLQNNYGNSSIQSGVFNSQITLQQLTLKKQ